MTKTLTEQWRDGKLPEGYYYIKGAFDDDIYISHLDYEIEEDKRLPVEEVVATVPSYYECKHLQEQLTEANDIIKEYVETTPKIPNDGFHIPNYNLDNAECYLEKWGVK